MRLARTAARMVARYGETMVLKRAGATDLPLKGKRLQGDVAEIGGTAVQQSFRVKIATVELAASDWSVKAPRRTDHLVVGGVERVLLDVRPLSDGQTVALYELSVAG